MDSNCEKPARSIQKPPYNTIDRSIITPLGKLYLRGPVNRDQIGEWRLSSGLNCFRPAQAQHKALVELATEPDGLLFTATLANTVISYASFQKPDFPWWQKRCFHELIELGGIETDPGWRKMGIIKALLDSIFKNPDFTYFEDFIVIAVHTIHSWDVRTSNIAPWAYRQLMIDIFSKYGFETWETDDPEVREHPCNILLARPGKNITHMMIKHFEGCCMGTN